MIQTGALVLYKNQIGLVTGFSDGKYSVAFQDSTNLRVREKDVVIIHTGPVSRFPTPRKDGDFKTAYEMLASDHTDTQSGEPIALTWQSLSELVFGEYTPETVAACLEKALEGTLFSIIDGTPVALSPRERRKIEEKAQRKQSEAAQRKAFIAWFLEARRARVSKERVNRVNREENSATEHQTGTIDASFLPFVRELESFALGRTSYCSLAQDLGLSEKPEVIHEALMDAGIWTDNDNPWPARSGCTLNLPKLDFPDKELESHLPRLDLSSATAYAIDNAWSTDPDDAIGYDGTYVWVHIADPASYIDAESSLDQTAMERGATLYLPEKTIPMLPEGAVHTLGLGLNPLSPALSFRMKVADDGSVTEVMISPSTVKVSRLSYEKADELLSQGDATLVALDRIAQTRKRRRIQNGAVEIDFPEVSIKVRADEIAFTPLPVTRSSGIVREMMLLAGEAAGRWARDRRLPFLYSSQEAPNIPAQYLADMERPAPLSVQFARRKGMRASIVGTETLAHRGLGLSFYSQVTSPLRRYQDLLTHYQIRRSLQREQGLSATPLSEDELGRRCLIASQASSQTRQAERDSRLHWTCVYLVRHPDWEGMATILELRENEAWVLIEALGLETSVRYRQAVQLDQKVPIKVVKVRLATLEANFEMK